MPETSFGAREQQRQPLAIALRRLEKPRELLERQKIELLWKLPKLAATLDHEDEPNLTLWAKFLSAHDDADLESLAMQHPVLKQAKDAAEELSDDPKARMQAEMREMALISHKLGLGAAREEGLEQGKVRGRAEGKAELLRKLLMFKFGPLPEVVTTRLEQESEAQLDEWFELQSPPLASRISWATPESVSVVNQVAPLRGGGWVPAGVDAGLAAAAGWSG